MRNDFILKQRGCFSSSRIGVFEPVSYSYLNEGSKDTMFDEAIIHSLSAEVTHKA